MNIVEVPVQKEKINWEQARRVVLIDLNNTPRTLESFYRDSTCVLVFLRLPRCAAAGNI